MASVLTMTVTSQNARTPSPAFSSQRNSLVSSAASYHTAPSFGSRSSSKSSSRSSSANTLSAHPAQGTDAANPIHVQTQDKQQSSHQNGSLPDDHLVNVGSHTIKVRSGLRPESLHTIVGKTLSQTSDALPQKHTEPNRPFTPPNPPDSASTVNSGSPDTPRSKPEFSSDVDTLRKVSSRSDGSSTIRRLASTDTGISSGSTVHQTSISILPPRKSSIGATAARSDDPGRPLDETDLIASSSLPARAPLAADGYLHPSSAATSHHHRPARRNTTGSVVVQLPTHTSRQLTGLHKHMPSQPALETTDLLDSDILEQADQIRRERLSKRAKAQQEAEAALTRAHSKRAVIEEEKVLVGNLIGEDHVNYVLMYNMLTGIRIGVSRCQAKVKRPLTDEDFTARHKFSFDIVGNELTPSAKYDFKFKDYAPWVFRELREEYFRLDPADYLLSLTAKYILSELGSPGKSGSFFYFSRDYRFIIKTIHHSEHKFLLSILKDYYHHVKTNPHTLLSRFYGLHRVKLPRGRKIHFVIMNNLFPPHRDIHETYDLKGSTVGRLYSEEKAARNPRAVLKDLNWINRQKQLELGPEKRAFLTEQLRSDLELLKKINVMDYSLLVGIHNMQRGNRDNLRSNTLKVFSPDMPRMRRRASLSRATKDETFAIRKAMRESDPKAFGSETTKLPDVEPVDDRQYFLFYQDEGGYRATNEFNSPQDTIYYLGIIDICTPYSTFKKLEHFWKGLSADRHKISPVQPVEYAQRFFNFLTAVMRGGGGGEHFKAE